MLLCLTHAAMVGCHTERIYQIACCCQLISVGPWTPDQENHSTFENRDSSRARMQEAVVSGEANDTAKSDLGS